MFVGSYIWRLRQVIGHELVVTPAAVMVAITPSNEVLLIKRADTGHWALPGGSAEPNSAVDAKVLDEFAEETSERILELWRAYEADSVFQAR